MRLLAQAEPAATETPRRLSRSPDGQRTALVKAGLTEEEARDDAEWAAAAGDELAQLDID